MQNKKPDPKDPTYAQYVERKQKILIAHAKKSIPKIDPNDGPFGDRELFDREVARFFVCSGAKMEIDPNAKGVHRHIVKTAMFGGRAKHLNSLEVENFRSLLRHDTA